MKEGRGEGRVRSRKIRATTAIVAIIAVFAMVGAGGLQLLQPRVEAGAEWAAISLNFGPAPVTQALQIQFSRVAYIDEPLQWGAYGFQGATVTTNGSWQSNTSGYGVLQYNSTAGNNAISTWAISGALGSNVSYLFANQRAALNGTQTIWTFGMFQGTQTTAPAASGNVTNANAGATQNAVWIVATHASGGNYTLKVGDWEEKNGGFQTLTLTAFSANVKLLPLTFYNFYIWIQKTSTVVSAVYTNNGTVASSVTVHPVMGGNMSKVTQIADTVFQASTGVNGAMILDRSYFLDHNGYPTAPAAQGAFQPLVVGALDSSDEGAPFDPAVSALSNYTEPSETQTTISNVNVSTSAFGSIVNSSTPYSETSSQLKTSLILNSTTTQSTAYANSTLTTIRSESESLNHLTSATLYLTTWTPGSINTQINGFLTGYVSSQSGVPRQFVVITGYTIQKIAIQSTFSSQASKTIHDYLCNAIPSFMAQSNLALVNPTTGAVDAGADLGLFLSPSGQTYTPHVDSNGAIFDPVNGETYYSPFAAGFPLGTTVTSAGTIYVPGQATFLGWNATGVPEFSGGDLWGSLTGAASSVSNFFGSAASSVANTVSGTAAAVSTGVSDVVQPVASTLGKDTATLTSDVSGAVSNVMPFFGGTASNVASSVSGTVTNSLSSVGGSIASAASGAAGAVLSGVNSVTNTISNIGASAASSVGSVGNKIVNTLGTALNSASAVISPYFSSVANLPSTLYNAASTAGRSLASLGSSVASAGVSALDSVGTTISNAASGIWSAASNAFGGLSSLIMGTNSGGLQNGTGTISWLTGLGNVSSLVWIVILIAVVLIVTLVAAFLLWRRHKRRHGSSGGKSRRAHRRRSAA